MSVDPGVEETCGSGLVGIPPWDTPSCGTGPVGRLVWTLRELAGLAGRTRERGGSGRAR